MPIPGQTPRSTGTSEVFAAGTSISMVADSNWHIGPAVDTGPGSDISRHGSPELTVLLAHTDTTATDVVALSMGLVLMPVAEYDQLNPTAALDDPVVRRVFNVQRWLQNGSQPPVQTSRMAKLITLHPRTVLAVAWYAKALRGSALQNGSLCWFFRSSVRRTEIA